MRKTRNGKYKIYDIKLMLPLMRKILPRWRVARVKRSQSRSMTTTVRRASGAKKNEKECCRKD